MAIIDQRNRTQPVANPALTPPVGAPTPNRPVPQTQGGDVWGTSQDPRLAAAQDRLGMNTENPPATPGMNPPASPRPNPQSPLATALNPYSQQEPGMQYAGGSGSKIGGVSAINPNANQMDYKSLQPFIDSAYNQAMTRLDPQLQQQMSKFDQDMVNRGIGVGSEAYNEAKQQLDFNQDDARQNAAFNAMGFGTGIQNQMFGQDATRSSLANSLLQARMSEGLGYAGLNQRGDQFNRGMDEQGRQFDNMWNQRGDQFYAGLGENARQFDDRSNMAWDAQGFGQMLGLDNVNFRNRAYNDSRSDYGNALLMSMLGYGGGQQPQWNADPNSLYAAQLGYGSNIYGDRLGAASGLATAAMGAF